ncbi:MAG: OmpA family protein [Flavobacteriales bacterium]|nr:MAG: OmpA family protein [Flavobacteriales bacterium]
MNFTPRSFLLASAFASGSVLLAQETPNPDSLNLVPNGSFEEVEGKLKRLGSIEMAKGWKSPTAAKADLLSETVANSPISAPRSQFGDQSALKGTNYAGLRWWSYQNKAPRTYLQAKLKKVLKKGQKYCVRYYVSLSDLSKYSSNELGVFMSKMLVNKDDNMSLTYNAQVPNLRTEIYGDQFGWKGVCGVYEAQGDEQYMIIGNFASNEKTVTGKAKRPKGETRQQTLDAYYFIDDINVWPIKLMSECSCTQLDKAESEFIYSKKVALPLNLKPVDAIEQATIYFKRFTRSIDGSMDQIIADMAKLMTENKEIKIKLTGHSDALEHDRIRMRPDLTEMAKERADEVKAALVEAGVEGERITTASAGHESPADGGDDDVALSKNRRVEVDILQ